MNNTMQLYIDDNNEVKGYPITTPDRVIDENGVSVKKRLKNNVKFDIVGKGEGIPEIDGKYDDTEIKKQIDGINEQLDIKANWDKVRIYDTVQDMKSDTKLKVGDICSTRGYYSIGEGGAKYQIKNVGWDEIQWKNPRNVDGGYCHLLSNGIRII